MFLVVIDLCLGPQYSAQMLCVVNILTSANIISHNNIHKYNKKLQYFTIIMFLSLHLTAYFAHIIHWVVCHPSAKYGFFRQLVLFTLIFPAVAYVAGPQGG